MSSKSVYKIGDWLLHRASGDIYEITRVYPDIDNPKYQCLKKFDGLSMSLYKSHYSSLKDYNNLLEFYELANSARILYDNK